MGGSHFVEAWRNDPETIEQLLDALDDDEDSDWRPRGVEWGQDTELLTQIVDLLGVLVSITAAHPIPHGGRRPTAPKPYPRPVRSLDAYRIQRKQRLAGELDDEVEQAKARWRAARERGELPEEN